MRVWAKCPLWERGAALVVVLLVVVVVFILVSAVFTATTNEVVIAGLYRDGVVAHEHAQAGLEEGFSRLSFNPARPLGTCDADYPDVAGGQCTFPSSLDSNTTVRVIVRQPGVSFAVKEVQADSTVGRARRNLSLLVTEEMPFAAPNFILGNIVAGQGADKILEGNVYSYQYVEYKSLPTSDQSITYAGGWIGKQSGGSPNDPISPCFAYPCPTAGLDPSLQDDVKRWFPAHRRAVFRQSCGPGVVVACDDRLNGSDNGTGWAIENCAPTDSTWGTQTEFNSGKLADGNPASSLGSPPSLCGNDADGLKYRWVKDQYTLPGGSTETRWFKTVLFAEWLSAYYDLTEEGYEPKISGCPVVGGESRCLVDGNGAIILANAQYGVVPPFPNVFDDEIFDVTLTDEGGNEIPRDVIGFCNDPDPDTFECGEGSAFTTVLADDPAVTEWVANKLPAGAKPDGLEGGAGVLVVRGNLRLNGPFTYHGTIIVDGTVFGAGSVNIYGGLMARRVDLDLTGNFSIVSGSQVSNVQIVVVRRKAWWER